MERLEDVESRDTAPPVCNFDEYTECRNQQWFAPVSILDEHIEAYTRDVKESCKICILAEISRQLRLLAVRTS